MYAANRLDFSKFLILAGVFVAFAWLTGCRSEQAKDPGAGTIRLTSVFAEGGDIPQRYTCDGEDISPSLAWNNLPAGTQRLALSMEDPDAPSGTFTHWLIYEIPVETTGLPEAIARDISVLGVQVQGKNSFGQAGYSGPCPPGGAPHHYIFTIYALDRLLDLSPGLTASEFKKALEGHILGTGSLTGLYGR